MSRFYEPLIWHQRGIRSHSVFSDRSQAMPVRRHEPVYVPPRSSGYRSYHDYGIDDSINRADYLSNAVLEDTFEAAARSRGKDHALLRNLNAAIVSTERHVNPRVAVVSRRVRASSVPPVARPFPGHYVQPQLYSQVVQPQLVRQSPARPVVIFLAPNTNDVYASNNIQASTPVVLAPAEAPWYLRARAASVPPPEPKHVRSSSVPPGYLRVQPVYHSSNPYVTANLWAHRPVTLRSNVVRKARARSLEPSIRADYYAGPYSQPSIRAGYYTRRYSQPSIRADYYAGPYSQPSIRAGYYARRYSQPSIPSTQLWAHRPRILSKDYGRLIRARNEEGEWNPGRLSRSVSVPHIYERASDYYRTIPSVQDRALSRYLYAHRGRFGPDSKPLRPSLGTFPQVYVPWKGYGPSNRSKAAVIGTRLEAESGVKAQRRPRSEFAAGKLRELKREEIEEGIYYRVPVSSALHASRPPLPKPTDRKSIRDNDGFTRPKNLLSWQYRVESRLSPNDLIYEPASYSRMRRQVQDVQEKMGRQRQLLDRYLDSDFKIPAKTSQNVGGSSAGGDPNNLPVSELRRKLRRTIARAKNNPDYFRE